MQIELSGKQFTLRCDMRALANAKKEAGIDIQQLDKSDDALYDVLTLVYYFAKSGAKHADVDFDYSADDFLGLIEPSDVEKVTSVVSDVMNVGGEKKR